jgi:DNA-binding NtrC family response regulator
MVQLFILEDDIFFAKTLEKALRNDDVQIRLFHNGKDFLDHLHLNPDIVTLDYNLPDTTGTEILKKIKEYNPSISTIILSGQQEVEVVVNAYSLGASKYIVKNENSILELKKSLETVLENIRLKEEVEDLREKIINRNKYSQIIGESAPILKVMKMIQKIENTNILTLITGDSGTGKELVANAIHYNSKRARKPFVAINVAAIPEDLVESELFGHEKGAFTGATSKHKGKFEEANGGTIFLDEIGEMDMTLQTKLLRVLQENTITRLGGSKEIKLNIRILAATNRNLSQRVKEGKFREDLFYRIQGFLIHLPPLCQRGNDIILLADYFIRNFCKENGIPPKQITKLAIKDLLNHTWPGNVRELKSLIERAILISDNDLIDQEDLIFSTTI